MTVSKGSDAIEKVCRSERQRAGERGGPKERWGRAERALELSHKKKKKQNSVPNDACFDFVWHDTGQERERERERERESSVCVQKYFTSRGDCTVGPMDDFTRCGRILMRFFFF